MEWGLFDGNILLDETKIKIQHLSSIHQKGYVRHSAFDFGRFDSFLAGLDRSQVYSAQHVALFKQTTNQFKLVLEKQTTGTKSLLSYYIRSFK